MLSFSLNHAIIWSKRDGKTVFGVAKLPILGASKHYDDETGENTSTLLGVNTKGYAPVEQMTASFTSFSPATDIYSLGATMISSLQAMLLSRQPI